MVDDLVIKEYKQCKMIRFVKLGRQGEHFIAKPILGDFSTLKPIIRSDGFIEMPEHVERLEKSLGVEVNVL